MNVKNTLLSVKEKSKWLEAFPVPARFMISQVLSTILGFLLAQTNIFGNYAPFGLGVIAAAPMENALMATLGASAGYIAGQAGMTPLRYIAAAVAIFIIRRSLDKLKNIVATPVFAPLTAFLCCLTTGLAVTLSTGATAIGIIMLLSEALLAAGSAFFLSKSIGFLIGSKGLRSLSQQEMASLIIAGCLVMMSLTPFNVSGIAPIRIVAVFLVLLAARYGHEAAGSIAGIAAGITMSLSGGMGHLVGAYAFGGLMAGAFAPLGTLVCAAAFAIANGIIVVVQQGSPAAMAGLYEVAVATLVFVAMPASLGNRLEAYFKPAGDLPMAEGLRRSVVMRLLFAAKAMSEVSESVEAVAQKLKNIAVPDQEGVYQEVQNSVCYKCGLRSYCWENNVADTRLVFQELSTILRSKKEIEEADVPHHFLQRCIRIRPLIHGVNMAFNDYLIKEAAECRVAEVRSVVADQFDGLGDMLEDLANEFEDAERFDPEASARINMILNAFKIYPREVSCVLDRFGRMTVKIHSESIHGRIDRNMLTATLNEACDRVFDPPAITSAGDDTMITFAERASLSVRTGAVQFSGKDATLCGDAYECFSDGRGRAIMVISDGMGSGGRAAVDGAMAVGLLSRLVKAGFGFDCSLKVINSALLVKSGDESLATLDIACLDLFTGRCDFHKAGAPVSFVRRGGRAAVIEQSSLPAGIIREVKFSSANLKLTAGDVVLMVSDGAILEDTEWIKKELEAYQNDSAHDLAKRIAAEAKNRRKDAHEDDITVVAAFVEAGI